jgi:hypothetical protein
MDTPDTDLIRRLRRLFTLYERAEEMAAAGRLDAGGLSLSIAVLRQLSFDFWREFFAGAIDTPAHQRYVLQ